MKRSALATTVAVITLLVNFQSCNLFPTFETTWHVTKMETEPGDKESESIYTDAYLSFYKGGVVSFLNKNEHDRSLGQPLYREGTWSKEGNELKVKLNRTTIDATFNVIELSNKWLVLEIERGPKATVGTILKCQPSEEYRTSSFDLLDPKNNSWRVQSKRKENAEEIKTRVLRHVDFLLGYFDMVNTSKQSYFETGILHTPFRFYSNGMALADGFETDDVWLNNFYDEADAAQGAKLLKQGLNSIDVYPADEKSFTKSYFNVLKLIKEHIEK